MPTQYDKLCTVVYTIDGIEHTTQMTTPAIYRDETIEFLLREMQPSARLISTEWQQIPKWIIGHGSGAGRTRPAPRSQGSKVTERNRR